MSDQPTGRHTEAGRDDTGAATPRQRVLNDRYELGDPIGRGGMADVWLARDLLLGRDVAVKILRSDLARDPVFQARFRREAKAVAGLNDHGIVAVYDTGDTDVLMPGEVVPLKVPFIVMEFVRGHTLKSRVSGGPLPAQDAVNATLGVLAALTTSHAQGIVHRDIKPANVMITDAGTVKVMDFGIARALADSAATMTQTQAVVGTAQYLSPEQARGESVDERSDLYSTGCLLFELLTGRPPFIGDSPVSVAYQHVGEVPQAASSINPTVTPELDAVLAHALTKDRTQRFQTAAEFSSALRAAQRGEMPTQVHAAALDATQAVPMTSAVMAASTPVPEYQGGYADPETGHGGAADDTGFQPAILRQDRDDEEILKEERSNKTLIWVVSLLLGAIIAVAAVFFVKWLGDERERNEPVSIPAVAGKTAPEAEKQLSDLQLKPSSVQVFSDTVKEGQVIDTDPAADQKVKKDSQVTIRVSKGPENVKIPDNLSGKTVEEVRTTLAGLNLEVAQETRAVEDNKVEKGLVTGTDPKAGTSAKTGSAVTILVSKGQVSIPADLEGKTEQEARKQLTDLGLVVDEKVTKVDNADIAKDLVVSTNPAPGTEIKVGGTVKLSVSKGEAKIPDGLVGKTVNEATTALNDAGFTSITIEKVDDNAPKDQVIAVAPKSGETLTVTEAVTLKVSNGPKTSTMPSVLGMPRQQASDLLSNAENYGLKVQITEVNQDDTKPGQVLTQSVPAGQEVKAGSTVVLTVQQAAVAPPE